MNRRVTNRNVGVGFPFGFAGGKTVRAGGDAYIVPDNGEVDFAIQGGAKQIVLAERGERVMMVNLGGGLGRYLFHPLSSLLGGLLALELQEQVALWCPRATVRVQDVIIDSAIGSVVVRGFIRHNSGDVESAFQVGVSA